MNSKDVQTACTLVGQVITTLVNEESDPADKVSGSMAISMAALSMTACMIMDGFYPPTNKLPTEDHMLFTALLIWTACHLNDSGRLSVEFGPDVISTTMDHFEKFTGRNARPLLHKQMMAAFDTVTKVDRSSFGENSKFLPH